MTKDEIIDMAKQSDLGFLLGDSWLMHHEIEYFAKLVAAKEREACAKIVDDSYKTTTPNQGIPEDWLLTLSEQIRARGEA